MAAKTRTASARRSRETTDHSAATCERGILRPYPNGHSLKSYFLLAVRPDGEPARLVAKALHEKENRITRLRHHHPHRLVRQRVMLCRNVIAASLPGCGPKVECCTEDVGGEIVVRSSCIRVGMLRDAMAQRPTIRDGLDAEPADIAHLCTE